MKFWSNSFPDGAVIPRACAFLTPAQWTGTYILNPAMGK